MKPFILFMVLLSLICLTTSCYQAVYETTSNQEMNNQQADSSQKYAYPIMSVFSDTPTRIVYTKEAVLHYYNKITGEQYPFCFDSLCHHNDFDCISYKFEMTSLGIQTVRYSAYDNRFYVLRGEQFCSFSFDGSDLKIIHSFGEEGNFETEMRGYLYGGLIYLQIQGSGVYFLARDKESGKGILMCYDIETKAMKKLFHDRDTAIHGYLLSENGIYFSLAGKYSGLYHMNMDGSHLKMISEDIYPSLSTGIFDGEHFYFTERQALCKDENTEDDACTEKIFSLSLETGTLRNIADTFCTNDHTLLAVTDRYIYYTVNDPVSIGFSEKYYNYITGNELFNDYSRIYRLDRESKETVIVLDDLQYETKSLYFADAESVILLGSYCHISETNAFKNGCAFAAKLDENGMFTEYIRLDAFE